MPWRMSLTGIKSWTNSLLGLLIIRPPIVNFSLSGQMLYNMPEVLKQRIAVNSHKGYHRKRYKSYNRYDNLNCGWHRYQKQLDIPEHHKENQRLDRVSRSKHSSEQLTGICVIRGDRVCLILIHKVSLPFLMFGYSGKCLFQRFRQKIYILTFC